MTEDRTVTCPCGEKMELHSFGGFDEFCPHMAYYRCPCGWVSPPRDGTSAKEAERRAYEAAMKRAPNDGNTSDGYHTFNELYHHRAVLFAVIVSQFPRISWKARVHDDGTMYDRMFIVGIDTPAGPATYHYDVDPYWNMFVCKELERAPKWDGHTPAQAIERIATLTSRPENRPLTLPELFDIEDDDAAWVVAENGKIYAMGAECAQEWASEEHCLFFARKPTPEDIEAARKEKGNVPD